MKGISQKAIGLISQWPEIKNAEFELLEKLRRTRGFNFKLIDYLGYDVETQERLDHNSLEFAIAFHFDTPSYVDCFTYCAVINPIEYMLLRRDYGMWPAVNYLSHDAYAIAATATVLRYHLNNMLGRDLLFNDYPEFYPSVSRYDSLAPCKEFSRIFYCGINWERIIDPKGRHDDLLSGLDTKNIIAIYGPKRLEGNLLWKGFKNYRSEIPFDGISIIKYIHECGISLVLSSDIHLASETASSRIYESCAAGAVIISDENPFIKREFGDSVLYFNRTHNAAQNIKQINNHYEWIKKYPDQAAHLAEQSQKIFFEKFSTEKVFSNIRADFSKRCEAKKALSTQNSAMPLVSVLFRLIDYGVKDRIMETIKGIDEQDYPNIELIVVCYAGVADYIKDKLKNFTYPWRIHIIEEVKRQKRNIKKGKILSKFFKFMNGQYIAIIELGWKWHANHISSLIRLCSDTSSLAVSATFADDGLRAPRDVSKLDRFFAIPEAEYFEWDPMCLLDLPAILLARSLFDRVLCLIDLFEYQEALLFFMEAQLQGKKVAFSKKFTTKRFVDVTVKTELVKKSSKAFWKKASDKLGLPEYERKLIFDRVRFSPNVKEEVKRWLMGSKKSLLLQERDEFEALVANVKKRFPKEAILLRFLFRLFRLPFKLIPRN